MSAASLHDPAPPAGTTPPAAVTRVGRNTAFRVAAQAASALVNVAGMVLLGNHLSAAGYGEYVFWYALIPLAASVADLGVGVIVTREVARTPEQAGRVLGDGVIVRALVGLLLLGGVAATAWPLLGPARATLALLVTAAALFDFGLDAAVWAFRGRERLDLEAVLLLVSQLAWLAGIALGVWLSAPLAWLLASAALAFVLRTAVGVLMLARRGVRIRFAPRRAHLAALVREGWPVGLSLLLVVVYGRTGVFTLKALSTAAEVACFNVAYMLSQPLGFVASALSVAAFPAFARFGTGDDLALRSALRAAQKYQLLISLPLAAGLSLLAARVVPLFFHAGAGYERAVSGLAIVALGLPFVFFNLQSRYLLAAVGRQGAYLGGVAAGLLVNLAGCLASARAFGAVGAAWSFVAAEVVVFLVCQRALPAHDGALRFARSAARPVLAAALMAAVVFAVRPAPLAVAVLAGVVAYAAALFVTRALSREEWKMVRRVILSFRLGGGPHIADARRRA